MAESESHSHLASPGEGDVERLLQEAETLTQEVARETGTPARNADALLSGELSAAPDPLAAVEAASTSVMSLEDLLGELGPAPEIEHQTSHPKRRSHSAPSGTTSESPSRADSNKPPPIDGGTRRPGPRVEHMPGEGETAPAETVKAESKLDADQNSTEDARAAKQPRRPLGRRILSGGKATVRGVATVALLVVRDLPIGALSSVDLPFRRTPRTIKNTIGIIGAITLVMGALAWAMPDLMKPKPPSAAGEESHEEAPAAHDGAPAAHESGHSGGH